MSEIEKLLEIHSIAEDESQTRVVHLYEHIYIDKRRADYIGADRVNLRM